ncbi:hypothetical protein LCY76_23660 [Fictibacillus sp. KIGAM418]|uniref:Uncharacterized protein n=1 Tax=Fictibacillus marinisediminis TaxID=2878389 RepID=A0A9X2BG95_9BACL|nr:hypothetical protein [Fictibacillus marinisediminis]MCK6259570.1 hypothetical protein [Fictibacillus marinisediminis]
MRTQSIKIPRSDLKVSGFVFPHFYRKFLLELDEAYQFPASAWANILALVCDSESTGIVRNFIPNQWAKKLSIPASSFYYGYQFLIQHKIIKEIVINNEYCVEILNYERFTKQELYNDDRKARPNYFRVPFALFETNILAEFVRTKNPRAIKFTLKLFNQLRVKLGQKRGKSALESSFQVQNLSTLKKELNRTSKEIRAIFEILKPIFNVHSIGLSMRKHQVWVKAYQFSFKEKCVEQPDVLGVDQLMAAYSDDLSRYLDRNGLRYKKRDRVSIMLAFKQEVVENLKYVDNLSLRDGVIKEIYGAATAIIEERLNTTAASGKRFKIYSLGAYFRVVFRSIFEPFKKTIPAVELIKAHIELHLEKYRTKLSF